MDTTTADRAPGVLAVYTPFRSLKLYAPATQQEGSATGDPYPPLQNTKVRYYGQIIGLVVAESFEEARDAAGLIKTEYEEVKPSLTWDEGMPRAFEPKQIDHE